MKCISCRREEATDTLRDKLTTWFLYRLFPQTVKDERTQARLEGFSEGYIVGVQHEHEKSERVLKEMAVTFNSRLSNKKKRK